MNALEGPMSSNSYLYMTPQGITAVLLGLYYIHRKSRNENRIKLEQYEEEQVIPDVI